MLLTAARRWVPVSPVGPSFRPQINVRRWYLSPAQPPRLWSDPTDPGRPPVSREDLGKRPQLRPGPLPGESELTRASLGSIAEQKRLGAGRAGLHLPRAARSGPSVAGEQDGRPPGLGPGKWDLGEVPGWGRGRSRAQDSFQPHRTTWLLQRVRGKWVGGALPRDLRVLTGMGVSLRPVEAKGEGGGCIVWIWLLWAAVLFRGQVDRGVCGWG